MNGYNGVRGTYYGHPVHCPVSDSTCPYWNLGYCCMVDGDPVQDCDDFNYYYPTWEDWEG